VTVKTFIFLDKKYISKIRCSFELSIQQRIQQKKMYHCFHKNIKQQKLFSAVIIIKTFIRAA